VTPRYFSDWCERRINGLPFDDHGFGHLWLNQRRPGAPLIFDRGHSSALYIIHQTAIVVLRPQLAAAQITDQIEATVL
jgi:hypothetical protein